MRGRERLPPRASFFSSLSLPLSLSLSLSLARSLTFFLSFCILISLFLSSIKNTTKNKTKTEQANIKAKNNGGLPPPADAKAVHVLSSCLKAGATWTRVRSQQDARECCGGMGFLAANRIGVYKADQDVDVTFEGDNTVREEEEMRERDGGEKERKKEKEKEREKERKKKLTFFLSFSEK